VPALLSGTYIKSKEIACFMGASAYYGGLRLLWRGRHMW
jgi:hypothetical protein